MEISREFKFGARRFFCISWEQICEFGFQTLPQQTNFCKFRADFLQVSLEATHAARATRNGSVAI